MDRQAIQDAGLTVTFAEKPSILADHGFTTGWIPAESFERVLATARMSVGMEGGLGCAPAAMPEAKRNITKVPDDCQTLAELQALNPDPLIPMHCSGETFISMVQQAMPDRFVRSSTGTRFTFSA